MIVEHFAAHFSVDQRWEGRGSFDYNNGTQNVSDRAATSWTVDLVKLSVLCLSWPPSGVGAIRRVASILGWCIRRPGPGGVVPAACDGGFVGAAREGGVFDLPLTGKWRLAYHSS